MGIKFVTKDVPTRIREVSCDFCNKESLGQWHRCVWCKKVFCDDHMKDAYVTETGDYPYDYYCPSCGPHVAALDRVCDDKRNRFEAELEKLRETVKLDVLKNAKVG